MSKHQERHYSIAPGLEFIDIDPAACELLTLFFADKPIQSFLAKHNFKGLEHRYDEHKEKRIPRLLFEIAAIYRLTSWRLDGVERELEKTKTVGVLWPKSDDTMIDLTMHEACNKIIHADEIVLEVRKVRKADRAYLKEDARLFGTHKGKEWMAGLWIPEFCDAALRMPMLDVPF